MDLKRGDKFGDRYHLLSKLGEGGMGEVWKARDTRLNRDVALKVSKAEFTARFEREAQAIAAFNHPNICQIYDVGSNFIVMEWIDGVQLSGPLPVDKAVAYAGQILDALDAAHRKAFTHRDLKPANVMVASKGGTIKLLDFGLAKQSATGLGPDDVTGAALTRDGQITGTLQYMSPEQLQGKDADARSDIFAFGCVLYEMLSGKKAFSGATSASVIAAVLEREPEPLQTTPPLDRVIRRCLAKDPDGRFQTTRDLKAALLWAVENGPVAVRRRVYVPWLIAAALGLATLGLAALRFPEKQPELRLDIVTPPTSAPDSFALSADGRKIAYVATTEGVSRLWVRPLDSTSAQPLPGTEGASHPFWSPDGGALGFFASQKLKRINLNGGPPQPLADVPLVSNAYGTWGEDGTILFNWSGNGALLRVPAAGGRATLATARSRKNGTQSVPGFIPGGRHFLFTSVGTEPAVWLADLGNEGAEVSPRMVTSFAAGTQSPGEYLPPGWLINVRADALVAQRFDVRGGRLQGESVIVAGGVGHNSYSVNGSFSTSASGRVAWREGPGNLHQMVWFNRSGQNVSVLGTADESSRYVELSPDGVRAAVTRGPAGSSDVWVQEAARTTRFTLDRSDLYPIWSPDGTKVAFASSRTANLDLYIKSADGSGTDDVLLASDDRKVPTSWSPDGRYLLYAQYAKGHGQLMLLPLTGDRRPLAFLSTAYNEEQGVFSPDGKWVAWQSDQSGQSEIFVRPFPGPGGQFQVSATGGTSPRWRGDGKELYFLSPDDKMMAAKVTVQGATLTPGTPEVLFQTRITHSGTQKPEYDVAKDGRFLIVTELDAATTKPIHVLLNWHPPK